MPWWGWIAIGTLLLLAEMTVVDLEFYLFFLGASAFLVGTLVFVGLPMPFWLQWIVFAVLAIASLVVFRRRVYEQMRPPPDAIIREGVDGESVTSHSTMAPGETGSVSLRGTPWRAQNVGSRVIPAGVDCLVERANGLVLEVHLSNEGEA